VRNLLPRLTLGTNALLLIVALYLAATQNLAFWTQVLRGLPADRGIAEYELLGCLFVALMTTLLLMMAPFASRWLLKPALGVLLVLAAVCGYFMDSFGAVIDREMLVNVLNTDVREAGELLDPLLFLRVLVAGGLPLLLLCRVEVVRGRPLAELGRRVVLAAVACVTLVGYVMADYKDVALWTRKNRQVQTVVNPTYALYSAYRQAKAEFHEPRGPIRVVAADAHRRASVARRPRVVFLFVGETVRAANFGLDGYARDTTPELAALEGVVSFTNVRSCGTSTAVSVPCMFSRLGRADYGHDRALAQENLLDVLQRAGVNVLWRDNNSGSFGVASRVPYEDLRRLGLPGLCDGQRCRDEVLLHGLDELLATTTTDRLVVLHMIGSHGPSYFRRYPAHFRRFQPECALDAVQRCDRASIVNAYDNTVLYGDHVLAQAITLLARHADHLEPTFLYLSDHGESLGEDGLYLHGLPYVLAPDQQKQVPFVVWAPTLDHGCLEARRNRSLSHDNLFDTVLGLFEVATTEYQAPSDALHGCAAATEPVRLADGSSSTDQNPSVSPLEREPRVPGS
jgi:lipid A ethanolaminephosphotransferase